MGKSVVITGVGVVSPIGIGRKSFESALFNGESGVTEISLFDASTFPSRLAAEVKGFVPDEHLAGMDVLDITADRRVLFANAASRLAVEDAAVDPGLLNTTGCGVIFGAGVHSAISDPGALHDFQKNLAANKSFNLAEFNRDLAGDDDLTVIPANLGAITVAHQYKIRGLCYTSVSACAAASQAIGQGYRAIERGELDVALVGGYDSMIFPLGIGGFCLLEAMTRKNDELGRAIKPFDKNRDGFAIGEGAGVVVLEDSEHARNRKAHVYGELKGYGTSTDAYRVTDPHPDGRGASSSMTNAVRDAGLNVADIDYINAHGTATPKNDRVETRAIKDVFGAHAFKVRISSVKAMVGHLMSAAGAIEFIATVLAVQNDCVPPTINYSTPDEECDLNYVPNTAEKIRVNAALSNSFGFGGQNSTLVVGKYAR